MNILIVADVVTFSGVGNYIKQLTAELVKSGHKVVILSPTNDIGVGGADGVFYERLNSVSKNPIEILKSVRTIKRIVKKYNIDIAHAQHRMSAFLLKLYKLFHHLPVIYTIHTSKWPMNTFKKWFGYYGDYVIAISSECKEFLINTAKVKPKKIQLILNGVDRFQLTPLTCDEKVALKDKYNIPQDKIVICMHGRLDPVKGIDKLVEAVSLLPLNLRDRIHVILSGKTDVDYYKVLCSQIDNLGLKNKVTFLGWIDSRTALGMADLMVAPSLREGFSLSCVEAMIMKVPVIRSKTGGYEDMRDFVDCLNENSPQEISEKISQFLYMPQKYEALIATAYVFATSECTIEKMTDRTVKVYKMAVR